MTILVKGSGSKGVITIAGGFCPMLDSETVNRSLVMKFGSLVSPDTMTITNDDKPGERIEITIKGNVAQILLPDKSSRSVTSDYKRTDDRRVITLSAVSNALHTWGIGKVSNGTAHLTISERKAIASAKAHAKADSLDAMSDEAFEIARKRKPKTVATATPPVIAIGETKADKERERVHKANSTRGEKLHKLAMDINANSK